MHIHDEYRAALAIQHTPGLGSVTWKRIAHAYSSLIEAARDADSWPARGLARPAQAQAFRRKEWREAAGREYDAARAFGAAVTVWSDPAFPARLKDIPDPPLRLYYAGDLSLASGPCVGMVGTRRCSAYGLEMAARFGEGLSAAGVCVASGMAQGIDRQAHLAGLSGPGGSIGVLGTGLDRIYPAANADVFRRLARQGLLLSEYPPGMHPEAHNFPVRNRIISGLSLAVLVVEAGLSSGSLITARQAAEQGREVFAVPGPLDQPGFAGCNALLRDGATLARSAEEMLACLGPELRHFAGVRPVERAAGEPPRGPAAPEPAAPDGRNSPAAPSPATAPAGSFPPSSAGPLSPREQAVMELLGDDRVHIDVLGRRAGLSSAEVSRALISLEVRGLVRQWTGMLFSRP